MHVVLSTVYRPHADSGQVTDAALAVKPTNNIDLSLELDRFDCLIMSHAGVVFEGSFRRCATKR